MSCSYAGECVPDDGFSSSPEPATSTELQSSETTSGSPSDILVPASQEAAATTATSKQETSATFGGIYLNFGWHVYPRSEYTYTLAQLGVDPNGLDGLMWEAGILVVDAHPTLSWSNSMDLYISYTWGRANGPFSNDVSLLQIALDYCPGIASKNFFLLAIAGIGGEGIYRKLDGEEQENNGAFLFRLGGRIGGIISEHLMIIGQINYDFSSYTNESDSGVKLKFNVGGIRYSAGLGWSM
jgi:hypothetical protein